jgi:Ca-activated chloride channel homolog
VKGLVAASLLWLAAGWLHLPAKVESWLFNPRERTAEGIEALEQGDAKAAADALDAAARLAPDDPVTRFNAGTGRLLAERDDAVEELQQASEMAPSDLRPRALYNLGNAQLAAGQPAAAVEAFKSSLRLAPDQLDAKHNLELALRALKQQKSQHGQDQETPQGKNQGEQEQSSASGAEQQPDDSQSQAEGDEASQNQNEQGQPQPGDEPSRERPLPNFEDQPDMTAEQAAAILEAVENLEREQRKQQAADRLKTTRRGDRDW